MDRILPICLEAADVAAQGHMTATLRQKGDTSGADLHLHASTVPPQRLQISGDANDDAGVQCPVTHSNSAKQGVQSRGQVSDLHICHQLDISCRNKQDVGVQDGPPPREAQTAADPPP